MNEKFEADEFANQLNSRVLAPNSLEVSHIMKSKNSPSVMVFSKFASNEKVIPPHFIKANLKINTPK